MDRKYSRALWLVVFFAFVGATLTGWLAPKSISWYFNPPVDNGGCNCVKAIDWSLHKMQVSQLTGFGVGALVGLVLAFTVFKGRRSPMEPTP